LARGARDHDTGGGIVQTYYFDLYWNGGHVVDEDGVGHFDEGSAMYYGKKIAERILRDPDYRAFEVHVLTDTGLLLGVIAENALRKPKLH
jgi:hypothetical protein